MLNSNNKDIRQLYLDFFHSKGHKIYDSMPLVPDDASLLFTNAGMVQFKDIFTGKVPLPSPNIATSSQLCIRAGGKHNDLENVGYTARHHTLFEMLGNFSFGAYFKKEAISYAWEFVTQILGFDKSIIYVSVHDSDDEAYAIWQTYIDKSHIKKMGDKDNFWQMGDSGPCGPCSEIYIDQLEYHKARMKTTTEQEIAQNAAYLANIESIFSGEKNYFGGEGDRFLEIWNLVFMQYEQKDGKRTPLPKPSIDTGMGLERVIALKEGKINNFDTSLFAPLMATISRLVDKPYMSDEKLLDSSKEQKNITASFRVIADHARSVAFLLAQGVNFDKEGRGYVLRRILRRAVRHGYMLGLKTPFLHKVVTSVCESMGSHYGYLQERKDAISKQCYAEEERFFETIELGMELFNEELEKIKKSSSADSASFSGEVAFKLYDTYGFPLDLTQDMLKEWNIKLDMQSFESCMNTQKSRSKASWKGSGDKLKEGDFALLLSEFGENEFVGYTNMQTESKILALLDSSFHRVEKLESNQEGFVLLDSTPFYPQSGGPVGDKGILQKDSKIIANVLDTQKYFGLNLSQIQTLCTIKANEIITAKVDDCRLEIIKHHSATHLLHKALREILGTHIAQAGSLVEAHRLRFDFSHPQALSSEELAQIESLVNSQILNAYPQICENLPINEAKAKGAMALFGEKYGEVVRVISFGDSIELCGGVHVANTAYIGSFYIVKESGVSSGVRRIEAVCGAAAIAYANEFIKENKQAKALLKTQDLLQAIAKLKDKKSEKSTIKPTSKDLESTQINGINLIISKSQGDIKAIIDEAKNRLEKVAILLIDSTSGKIAAGVKNAPINASDWVKIVAQQMGGNGGGRADFATAGAKEMEKIELALQVANDFALKAL